MIGTGRALPSLEPSRPNRAGAYRSLRGRSGNGEPPAGGSGGECLPQTPAQPDIRIPRKVVKGGSFLCATSCCRRCRPAARHAQMVDSGMSYIGFRCVRRGTATAGGHA